MTITVRPAHTSELADIGELTLEAYAEFMVTDDGYAHQLRDAVTRAREAELYVALLDDALAGTVTFCPQGSPWGELAQPGEGELRMLAVRPSARSHGIARSLVSVCLERSLELGYHAVVLSTLPQMAAAHRLYQRLGFRRLPERDWSPAEGVDLMSFYLDLRDD
jgi:ribosomal protein S18 acetylase RimI-like enzyme